MLAYKYVYDILTKEQYLNFKCNEIPSTFSYMYHNWEDEKTDNIKKSR